MDLFYINTTTSCPQGVYIVAIDQQIHVGDYVIMRVPEEMEPYIYGRHWSDTTKLLKTVAGISGESFEIKDHTLIMQDHVAHIQSVDDGNLPLPQLADGNYIIAPQEFLAVSWKDHSFDGRYFGAMDQALIIKKVVPFLMVPSWL